MRSRILIGAGAWLLGAAAATAGSMYAVDQLGQDLLYQQSEQVSVAMVNSELARENAESVPSPSQLPTLRQTQARTQAPAAGGQPGGGGNATASASPSASSGQLLTSSAGSVVAQCRPAGAYLVAWSPQQNYEVAHVVRGPGSSASVTFRSSSGGLVLTVTCQDGQPILHTQSLGSDSDD